ncbi:MAG: DUF4251 domain-containing protein, partial [Prolixibacteraceae bacterium]|nr:DUF4251 domain-containing protein [Prolixibacteraceae bacterium]
TSGNCQEQKTKNRKQVRKERQTEKIKEIQQLLDNKTFIFKATHALPMGGGSIQLDYSFDAEVKNDTIDSYLPFFGVAYRVDYGGRDSGFNFTEAIENYKSEKSKNGYLINFDVKNKMDYLNFTFHISKPGYATLNIISTNRQAISYYGYLETPKE